MSDYTLLFPYHGNVSTLKCCLDSLLKQCKKEGRVENMEWITKNVHSPRLLLSFSPEIGEEFSCSFDVGEKEVLLTTQIGQSLRSLYEGINQVRAYLDTLPSKMIL